ncbi:MAG: DUF3179 domain-containing protein [Actinobacteria bacterium]|nr:DUF3179 domain-containing protein [Actinomycetota bacterium]
MGRQPRLTASLILFVLFAASCSRVSTPGKSPEARDVELPQAASSPKENGPSALQDPSGPDLPEPLVDPSKIIPGGPPPDGIPPIDRPKFNRTSEVEWLKDREPVVALELGGENRAYPTQILTWHEIVNDTVGKVPVTVTYCPLCNSATAFDRRVGERIVDFGTSGKLYNSALVMYDRQTESLWSQFEGKAIAGRLTGTTLEIHPLSTVSWASWRNANPDGWVLSKNTGFDRDYGRNPYVGYDDREKRPFLFEGETDGRMPAMTRVVGIRVEEQSAAVVLDTLIKKKVMHLELAGQSIVVFARPGTASALDTSEIPEGKDVGETGVFKASVDRRASKFMSQGGLFVDSLTGTKWDILGNAVAGPKRGEKLQPIEHVDTFWFAWAAFLLDTKIIR